jgi:Mrp family chromosome partitioning ATPase
MVDLEAKAPPRTLEVKAKMSSVKYKITVLSGKGGVKSTFMVNLAVALAANGHKNIK